MTTATTEQKQEETNNAAEEKQYTPDQNIAITHLANKMLGNVNLAEAFSLVPLGQLINLVQQQVIEQAKKELEGMSDEQINKEVEEAKGMEPNVAS
jgi:hypothetical protein